MAKQGGGGEGQVKMACNCASPYQDERYGKGIRIHTNGAGKKKTCSVCGKQTKVV